METLKWTTGREEKDLIALDRKAWPRNKSYTLGPSVLALSALLVGPGAHAAGEPKAAERAAAPQRTLIQKVESLPAFFNPSLGQDVKYWLALSKPGVLSISILDRDRIAIRKMAPIAVEKAGAVSFAWDGRDDSGGVVPDEAFSIRAVFRSGNESETYDPAEEGTHGHDEPAVKSYSRVEGVLSYELKRPSRVHIQAGEIAKERMGKSRDGCVLKTIVNREPRAAGLVIEKWSGFDESGTILVPDLRDFAISNMATPLPENAVITIGSRRETYLDYARRTRGGDAIRPRVLSEAANSHHHGLNAFEDRSPAVTLSSNGSGIPRRVRSSFGTG